MTFGTDRELAKVLIEAARALCQFASTNAQQILGRTDPSHTQCYFSGFPSGGSESVEDEVVKPVTAMYCVGGVLVRPTETPSISVT